MVKISVIIVNWNTKQLVLDCINSIKKYTKINTEIIVVDNASTDKSVEAIRVNHPDVLLIQNDKNLGFSRANNIGIKKSQGEYIALINSDVLFINDTLDILYNAINKNKNIGVIVPKLLNKDMSFQPSCREFPRLWNNFCQAFLLHRLFPKSSFIKESFIKNFDYNKTQSVNVVCGCFMLVRKEVIDQVGLLDEDFYFYGEDVEWCKRIKDGGWSIIYNPVVEIIHLGGASTSVDPIKFWIKLYNAQFLYWKKQRKLFFLLYSIKLIHVIIRIILYSFKMFKRPVVKDDQLKLRGYLYILKYLLTFKFLK